MDVKEIAVTIYKFRCYPTGTEITHQVRIISRKKITCTSRLKYIPCNLEIIQGSLVLFQGDYFTTFTMD